MSKHCLTCEQTKPDDDFYSSSKTRCKTCQKAAVANYRKNNLEKVRGKDRERSGLPHRVAARESYSLTEAGKVRLSAGKMAWIARNPEKRAAHITLGNAVRDGKVIKPKRCNRCGEGGRLHAHHEDYAKPLAVEWLCSPCHKAEHKGG